MTTESPWRLIAAKGMGVTSEDDGHPFGLPAPVNAGQTVKAAVGQHPISRFEVKDKTGDLAIHFADDASIEFLRVG